MMFAWATFVHLGDPPAGVGLAPLLGAVATRQLVVTALGPYLAPAVGWSDTYVAEIPMSSAPGLVYVYGHAWLNEEDLYTVSTGGAKASLLDADAFVRSLATRVTGPLLLIVDTCHSAALITAIARLNPSRWTVICGSAVHESAYSHGASGSRLSIALARAARQLRRRPVVDALDLVAIVRRQLARAEVLPTQYVAVWIGGVPFELRASTPSSPGSLPSPHLWLRGLFVSAGTVVAAVAIALASYYHSHVWLEVRAPRELVVALRSPHVTVHSPDLDDGSETLLDEVPLPGGGVLRLRVPAGNTIVRLRAEYPDEQPRGLNYHYVSAAGWFWSAKRVYWILPPAAEVLKRPGMAYVPAATWLRGVGRDSTVQSTGFWIDLHPPYAAKYRVWLRTALGEGRVSIERSQMSSIEARVGALSATGLAGPLGTLMRDLEPALNVIDETSRRDRSPESAGGVQMPSLEVPCDICPALMTRREADAYCEARGMHVPTRSQWELAVRGVDGRAYPWGERYVDGRAHVLALPEKGRAYALAPVDAYRAFTSPFGLWDTVGNAGDWVDSENGYPQVFAGGNYRFNPEDANVVSVLPDTGAEISRWPSTTRCVDTLTH